MGAFSGRTVLVTGAGSGIGLAIARAFAREGARVLVHDVRDASRLAEELSGVFLQADLADPKEVEALGKEAAAMGVDVLVNNAGVFAGAPFAELTVADFDRIVAANLRSAFLVTRAFLPAMRRRGRGDVFFMSSIAGLGAYPNGAAYCAAKAGVTALARVLRAETKGSGLRVCCVHPGATWTPSWRASGVPAERMMPAADVARAFLDVWRLSSRTVVEEIVLRPAGGDI